MGPLRVYTAKSATHGIAAIDSATAFAIQTSSQKAVDPGAAGSPGLAEEVVTNRQLEVTVTAMDPSELLDLVEATAANFVGKHIGEGGAEKTITVKNVQFNDPPSPAAPAKDSGSTAGQFSITGRAVWEAADTWATMVVPS